MDLPNGAPDGVPSDLIFDFDIYADKRITDDVQGSYAAALRDAPDIFYTRANGGHWIARRYEDIAEIVKDPEHFSVREMQIPRVPEPPLFIPLSLDPPENIPYRQLLMPLFSPKAVQALEPRIRHWAKQIIDEVFAKGECDFVGDVSARFPVSVFMELMGLPLDRLRDFRAVAEAFFAARTQEAMADATGRIVGIWNDLIALRTAEPADDIISHFLSVEFEGRRLRMDEILAICLVLFLGGMHTVTNVTAFAFQYLAQDTALQARLSRQPDLISKFVEEALRCFGVINTPRLVVKDRELAGVHFRAGQMVLCLLPMAGRDDGVTDHPDLFDIDRPKSSHLTFSTGPHLCIGHNLARMELNILTEEWLKRIPTFDAPAGRPHGVVIGTVQTLESLPLVWG